MRDTSSGKCCFSPCDGIYFLGTRQHLSACGTSLPGCPANAPASSMSSTKLIIFLCKLMLIFLCSLFLLKTPIPFLSSWLETEESVLSLSSFLPESINCFNYQSSLCSISPIYSLLFFSTSNLVIHVTIITFLDYRNN